MLSDEERKAIDYLQLCYDLSTITNESLSKLGIVLNLIEKQSKEIEELKERNNELNEAIDEWINGERIPFNCVSKDKIKAKIEELENEKEKYFEKQVIQHEIEILQSLLEKE